MLGGAIGTNKLDSLYQLKLVSARNFVELFNEFYPSIDSIEFNDDEAILVEKMTEIFDMNEIKINSQFKQFMNKVIVENVNQLRYQILNKSF